MKIVFFDGVGEYFVIKGVGIKGNLKYVFGFNFCVIILCIRDKRDFKVVYWYF